MGYCNGDCEHLTSRHNCKKYKKGLTYSRFSSRSVSTGTVHERCSECDKDYWIAELEARLKPNSLPSETDPEDSIQCGKCNSDVPIDGDYEYCPYCGQKLQFTN